MFETFRNAWKTEDLRKRLLYTLLILILFRLGCAIPVPYITSSALESMFTTGSMLTYLNMMSGGAMSRCTIFALGVQPYINATIIIQLLCVIWRISPKRVRRAVKSSPRSATTPVRQSRCC